MSCTWRRRAASVRVGCPCVAGRPRPRSLLQCRCAPTDRRTGGWDPLAVSSHGRWVYSPVTHTDFTVYTATLACKQQLTCLPRHASLVPVPRPGKQAARRRRARRRPAGAAARGQPQVHPPPAPHAVGHRCGGAGDAIVIRAGGRGQGARARGGGGGGFKPHGQLRNVCFCACLALPPRASPYLSMPPLPLPPGPPLHLLQRDFSELEALLDVLARSVGSVGGCAGGWLGRLVLSHIG